MPVLFRLSRKLHRETPRFGSLTSVRDGPTVPPCESSSTSECAKGQNRSCCTIKKKLSIGVFSFGVRDSGMQFCMVVLIQLKML